MNKTQKPVEDSLIEAVREIAGNAYRCGNQDVPSFVCPELEKIYGFKTFEFLLQSERSHQATLTNLLKECGEALKYAEGYFDSRADAQYFPNSAAPVPNTEMAHLVLIRDLCLKLQQALKPMGEK